MTKFEELKKETEEMFLSGILNKDLLRIQLELVYLMGNKNCLEELSKKKIT